MMGAGVVSFLGTYTYIPRLVGPSLKALTLEMDWQLPTVARATRAETAVKSCILCSLYVTLYADLCWSMVNSVQCQMKWRRGGLQDIFDLAAGPMITFADNVKTCILPQKNQRIYSSLLADVWRRKISRQSKHSNHGSWLPKVANGDFTGKRGVMRGIYGPKEHQTTMYLKYRNLEYLSIAGTLDSDI
jgi:hypothetical protein